MSDRIANPAIRARWVKAATLGKYLPIAEAEHERCTRSSGWDNTLVHIRGDLFITDTCGHSWADPMPGVCLVSVALVRDHPELSKLGPSSPRALRNIYIKAIRVASLMATSSWEPMRRYDAAVMAAARQGGMNA